MRFRLFRLGCGAGLFALLLVGSGRSEKAAPGLSLRDLGGQSQSLESYRGKIVVLNFWATWCGPCMEEMPMLVKAQKRYGERGLTVIAVSLDDATARQKVQKFAEKKKVNFPIWVGGTVEDLERFGCGEALPATVFFDANGRIVGRVLGMLRKHDLHHRIEWMLGETKGERPASLVNNLGGR